MTSPSPSTADDVDPRGLIREAFNIAGVTEPDCRSIFFDWALGLPPDADPRPAIEVLLAAYADQPETHPMRRVLAEGLAPPAERPRRGGRRRRRDEGAG